MQRRISEMLDQCSHKMTSGDESAALHIAATVESQLTDHIHQMTPRSDPSTPIDSDSSRSGIPSLRIALSKPGAASPGGLSSPQDHTVLRAFEMMAQVNMHRGTLTKVSTAIST